MKKQIWKFPLPIDSAVGLMMPIGAEILCVQVQHGAPTLWAIVNPDAGSTQRVFQLVTTGQPFDTYKMKYVGTFQLQGGAFIGHLFERGQG